MDNQEIESAIDWLRELQEGSYINDTSKHKLLNTIISILQLFLEVKGMPKKKHWLPKNDLDNLEVKGFNSCLDLCTAYLIKKCEGIEKFIEDKVGVPYGHDLAQAIKEYLVK